MTEASKKIVINTFGKKVSQGMQFPLFDSGGDYQDGMSIVTGKKTAEFYVDFVTNMNYEDVLKWSNEMMANHNCVLSMIVRYLDKDGRVLKRLPAEHCCLNWYANNSYFGMITMFDSCSYDATVYVLFEKLLPEVVSLWLIPLVPDVCLEIDFFYMDNKLEEGNGKYL